MPRRRTEPVVAQVEGLLSRMAELGRSPGYRERLLRLADAPLHLSGWSIITVLHREGPQGVSALAELLDIDQSTVSRQLKPLAESGLVSRAADVRDRRSTIVALTAAGEGVFEAVRGRWMKDLSWFMREWTAEDRKMLGELAERFSAEIDHGRALRRADADDGTA